VTAADPNAAPKLGIARGTGKYDLAPGIKLQVTQVTSGKDGEPTRRTNTATIQWIAGNGELGLSWPIELMPGVAIDRIVWQRGGTALWILHEKAVRKIDFANAADVKEQNWTWDQAGDFGGAPADVRAEIEKSRPRTIGQGRSRLEFRLVEAAAEPDTEPLPAPEKSAEPERVSLHVRKSAVIEAADVEQASAQRNAGTGQWGISHMLTADGAERLSKASKENIGKRLAIVSNGAIVSAPTIRDEIGKAIEISGSFSEAEAKALADSIKPQREGKAASQEAVVVVDASGAITLDGKATDVSKLSASLDDLSKAPGVTTIIRVQASTPYKNVARIVEICHKAGRSVRLETVEAGPEAGNQSGFDLFEDITKRPKESESEFFEIDERRKLGDYAKQGSRTATRAAAIAEIPEIAALRAAVAAKETEFNAIKEKYLDRHPTYLRASSELDLLKGSLGAAVAAGEAAAGQPIRTLEEGAQGKTSAPEVSPAELAALRAALAAKEIEFTGIKQRYLQQHPTYVRASSELDALKAQLAAALAAGEEPVRQPSGTPGEDGKNLQAKPVDRKPSAISLTVVDAAGQQPIGEFRVVAGVKSGVSPGRDVVNWQPHTVRAGEAGVLIWPLDKAYDEMALRVEADGYAPQVFKWIKKSEGAREATVPLVKDDGIDGRVLTPDGRPAAGATVALAMVQRDAVIEGGKLRHFGEAKPAKLGDQWRRPIFVYADADGRFQLPEENEETAAVLIVHEAGVRELALSEFKRSPEVTLQPWGRLEGRVLWGDTPGSEHPVSLTIHRDTYGYPGVIAQYEKTKSAADGTFVFERVLPGQAQLSCPIAADSNRSGVTEINLPGRLTHVTVQPGATAVVIGGEGRVVKGRLTGPASWEGVTFHFHPTAPHVGLPGDNEMWKAWNEFKTGPSGSLFFRDGLNVNADGTFEVPNVLPGDYQIFFKRAGENGYLASGKFSVDAETPGTRPEAKDIGEIKARGGTN
jgi:biopolymer transport protein ExbD